MKKSTVLTIALIVCLALLAAGAWFMFGSAAGGIVPVYADEDKYSVGNAEITGTVENLDVTWTSGWVNVVYHDGPGVTVTETSPRTLSENDRLRWRLDGSTLRIQYAKSGIRLSFDLQKTLTVSLPAGTRLMTADIAASSGDVNVSALAADDIRISTASGDIRGTTDGTKLAFTSTSGDMDLKQESDADIVTLGATSGNISCALGYAKSVSFSTTSGGAGLTLSSGAEAVWMNSTSGSLYADAASVKRAEFTATSGNINMRFGAVERLTVDSTSGDVTAKLPAEPGFTCMVIMTSGSFSSDLPLSKNGPEYTCGDGSGSFSIRTTSGDVRIEKAE